MADADRIKPTDASIGSYLENLRSRQYQIPTFQREVVWEKDNIKRLWDSIYRFYPIGSILVWKTDVELQKHRQIGGHDIARPDKVNDFSYIIDGQQRTTALLTSLYGVEKEWDGEFDPTLYVDLTVERAEDVEDANYRDRFLFWDEIDTGEGASSQNTPRREKYDEGYIVKLANVKENMQDVERAIYEMGHDGYDDPVRDRLRHLNHVLTNYRVPFIELTGIGVDEVTEIFERVNQEGEPLNIFDIVVAKTFRPEGDEDDGFYLRELIEDFRSEVDREFADIDDVTYLQMLAMIIKYHIPDNDVNNITDTFLKNITTEQIEGVWEEAKRSFRYTFDFFENHLHLKGPNLIPFRYFYITIAVYFFENENPDYELLKDYFWFHSFHTDNLLRHTQHLRDDHLDWLVDAKRGEDVEFDRFLLDKDDLRSASYSYNGRFSRAILSLLAYQDPKDWRHFDRSVLSEVYLQLQHQPNLHHVFPRNFVANYPGEDDYDEDSLMNIAYLPQETNLEISDKNPVDYIKDYDTDDRFEEILETHLIDDQLLEWAYDEEIGYGMLDEFIDRRVQTFVAEIESVLDEIDCNIIDSNVQDTNIRVLMEDGEGQSTEFKSTLRTDIHDRGMPTSAVEYQSLKAINGFLNAPEGGTLLIGISDDGTVHGIDEDYATFSEEQKQEVFQRYLHDIIGSNIEDRFNDFVDVSVLTVDGEDVCFVDVRHATEPAFLEHNGDQEFYKRRGNRTIPLEPKEQADYIDQTFGNK